MTNKYGKSAIDAVRRNTLPLYLDEILNTNALSILEIVLEIENWTFNSDTSLYEQSVSIEYDKDTIAFIATPSENFHILCASYNILCSQDEDTEELVFTANAKPQNLLKMLIVILGGSAEQVLPVADDLKF